MALLAVAAGLLLTRWPLSPRYLLEFDSVNFALALEKFDPLYHQPQPPGYPFFVALSRLVHWFVPRPEDTLFLTGLLGAAAALLLLWAVGERMFGPRAGVLAALLLLVNPVFWRAGLMAPVRVFLAAASLAVAWAAWRTWSGERGRAWFCWAAVLLGLGAGFRPQVLLVLLPLVVVAGLRSRRSAWDFLLALALLAITTLSWLSVLLWALGGPRQLYELLRNYAAAQTSGSSPLGGASLGVWWDMVRGALEWNSLAVISWVWAVPLAWRQLRRGAPRSAAPFLALWFVPPFLFQIVVHTASPGHTLLTVPVLCLLGGWVLASWRPWVAVAAAGLNVLFFFYPPTDRVRQSSYPEIAHLDQWIGSQVEAIRQMRTQGPISLVCNERTVPWRHLSYYFPEDQLIYLRGTLEPGDPAADTWLLYDLNIETTLRPDEEIRLPPSGRVVWLAPFPLSDGLRREIPFREFGSVLYFDSRPGLRFTLGPYRFATGP